MFGEGCFSPVMYLRQANILINQPELLRILNSFEIQVLNFAGKIQNRDKRPCQADSRAHD